ncbi:MAG: lipoyl(octanoyl) transferase LipB [Chitinophagia bacterium]|nr:lipoyl(octanoyl) transferase LipB [Chitinophagia bacterium]
MDDRFVHLRHLGRIGYAEAWDLQERLLASNVEAKSAWHRLSAELRATSPGPGTVHHLLLCEHPPVYTLGKSGKAEHLLMREEEMAARGVTFHKTNRGGDITFHGPGQLVGYPILDLERLHPDIGRYLRDLEEVIIRTLATYGLHGGRSAGETGVWLDPEVSGRARKICAMGVRCSRWITMHGLALNVNTDLSYFDGIVPCGIRGKGVASLSAELGRPVEMAEVEERVCEAFADVFGCRLVRDASSV